VTRCALHHYVLLPAAIALCALAGQAQTGTSTRIEEGDKSIIYTGTWYTNGSSLHSGGGAALTNAIGATAVVTFTGTGITWLGVLDPWSGMATVYLDGTRNTVDTYNGGTLYQQALFQVRGLAAGPHTLSIEVTHMRDVNGLGSWVWIDGFDVENGSGVTGGVTATAGRTEQNNPALSYTGVWFPNGAAVHSGGSAALATDAGSRATLNFNGTGVTWFAYRDEWSGIARVYVDGQLRATVDTYLSPAMAQSAAYVLSGLAPGPHTLTIEVTGTHGPASGGSWIWVDAFEVVGSVSRAVPPGPAGVDPTTGSYTFTFDGGQDAAARVLINSTLHGGPACYLTFVPSGTAAGTVLLADNAVESGGVQQELAIPGSGNIANGQCSINAGRSSVDATGNTLTLTLEITFAQGFAGDQIFFQTAGAGSPNSNWQTVGAVRVR
jgi:hypothetical protein